MRRPPCVADSLRFIGCVASYDGGRWHLETVELVAHDEGRFDHDVDGLIYKLDSDRDLHGLHFGLGFAVVLVVEDATHYCNMATYAYSSAYPSVGQSRLVKYVQLLFSTGRYSTGPHTLTPVQDPLQVYPLRVVWFDL